METQASIVIDNGSSSIKCGFAGEEEPKAIISNVFSPSTGKTGQDDLPDNIHPIQNGQIKNMDVLENVWKYTFSEGLKVQSAARNVLVTIPIKVLKHEKEVITQIMFETFSVENFYISVQPSLTMYSVGSTTGVAIDSREDLTTILPVVDGFHMPYTASTINYGGGAVTDYLIQLLSSKGVDLSTYENKKFVKDIKEKSAYVCFDYDTEISNMKTKEKQFTFPDGSKLSIGKELFMCSESIFKPELRGIQDCGLQMYIENSIKKIMPYETRKSLYSSIVLSGGNTLFQGFPSRISEEIKMLAPSSLSNKVKVVAENERQNGSWLGGSNLANLGSFQSVWIHLAEYQESGPSIINRKSI
jgi:actin beta/gamma 1